MTQLVLEILVVVAALGVGLVFTGARAAHGGGATRSRSHGATGWSGSQRHGYRH